MFTRLVESLNLAGDLGLLLRIETARRAGRPSVVERAICFAPPEERIRAALGASSATRARATSTRRRLFAEDAAHGVALLGIAEKRFDVVLMNPPFGAGSTRAKKEFEKAYPRTKNDIYAAFVERGSSCSHREGGSEPSRRVQGSSCRASRGGARRSCSGTRRQSYSRISGTGVLDSAMVETAAYCLEARA